MLIAPFTRGIAQMYRCEDCGYEWIQSAGIGFHTKTYCYLLQTRKRQLGGQMSDTKTDGATLNTDKIVANLRQTFPHGHEDFLPTTVKELALHSAKNHDYAAGGSPMGNFDRVAAILALYPGLNLGDRRVVALAYALKQLDAVLWGLCKKIVHKVEGLNERLQDIAVYAKLVMCMNTEDARNKAIDQQFGMDLTAKEYIPEGQQANVGQRWAPSNHRVANVEKAVTEPEYRARLDAARMAKAVADVEKGRAMQREESRLGQDDRWNPAPLCIHQRCDYPLTCNHARRCLTADKHHGATQAGRSVAVSAAGVRDLTPDGRYMDRDIIASSTVQGADIIGDGITRTGTYRVTIEREKGY